MVPARKATETGGIDSLESILAKSIHWNRFLGSIKVKFKNLAFTFIAPRYPREVAPQSNDDLEGLS